MQFLNRISQLATPPVFHSMNTTFTRFYYTAVTINHRRNLFALVRMDDKYNFVMTHAVFLLSVLKNSERPTLGAPPLRPPRLQADEARQFINYSILDRAG